MQIPENFFTTEYLFSTTAPSNMSQFFLIFGIFVLLTAIGTILIYNRKIHKPLKARLTNFFLTIGIVGLLISFFRYESIPYIGSRFMILVLITAAILWYLVITIYSVSKMPKEIRIKKSEDRYIQYLPRKKKH